MKGARATQEGEWIDGWQGGRFKIKETTGDIGVIATGPSTEAAEASAVAGMYWIISPSAKRRRQRHLSVDGQADEAAVALARALQRLLIAFDTDGFIAATARVMHVPGRPSRCRIEVEGETYDAARHPAGVEIKAVTHHDLVLDAAASRVEVLFDI